MLTVKENGTPTKTFTYNEANQISNTGFSYDANGNMTSLALSEAEGDGHNFIYDGENRLKEVTKVSDGSTVAEYTYDYLGRRTSKTVDANTTYFHYDSWNVVAETDSAGSTGATYTYDNHNQLVNMTRCGQTYYYQYNAHGDVVSLTNSAGQVVNTYEYDPWGKILSETETVENSYLYAGYRYDEETGLYYLQHRYYDPEICRFLIQESESGRINHPQSLNSYVYCYDNPVLFSDYDGLWGREVHLGLTYMWAKEVGFSSKDALTIARACVSVDKSPYDKETGRHLNWDIESRPTQEKFAAKEKCSAIRNRDLRALGRGLHSIQDAIAHGTFPYLNRHQFERLGFDPDKATSDADYPCWKFYLFNLTRLEKTESASKAYLRGYLQGGRK